eukprot:2186902-Pleurochrysis_carterae.AAC.1
MHAWTRPCMRACVQVAGDLAGIEDSFVTMSGNKVRLAIWSEHENIDQLDWAMQSLKDSMKWDEETYGCARNHVSARKRKRARAREQPSALAAGRRLPGAVS